MWFVVAQFIEHCVSPDDIKTRDGGMIMMRILAMLVILCVLFCTGCASMHSGYDAGIAAYKRGNYKVALYDFEPRAMAGDPVAQFCLGFMYTHGQGVGKDPQKARKWYEKAILQSYLPAHNNVLVGLIRSKITTDKAKVIELIQLVQWMAEHGNPVAQYNLGLIYSQGYGVPRDSTSAAEWYQKAAAQGYARAQNDLGLIYLEGRGIEKNLKEAAKLFKMAADQGHSNAQYRLAVMFVTGEEVEKNAKEAAKLFKMAADQGHSDAQYNLAAMHYVKKNVEKAVELFKKAAKQGNPFAQYQLALMYNEGESVPKNSERAYRLLLESAQRGYGLAQTKFGRSIEKYDSEEAYYWYSLAIKDRTGLKPLNKTGENLIAEIASEHERIGKMLTKQQRNEIQNKVDNWKPKRLVSAGTGFYINEKHILTNAHVLYKDGELCDEFRVPYRPVVVDPKNKNSEVDLAVLFDPRGRKDTATFRSEPIVSGEDVIVFGYPLSGTLSYRGNLTVGTVSGLSGSIHEPRPDNLFQYTAPIQGGNSGGPVLDNAGNVIGVVVSKLNPSLRVRNGRVEIMDPQNVNFAIKFDVVKEFLKKNNITDYASTENLGNAVAREEIYKKARNWTVPVWCFKNKGEIPLPLVEIGIDELNR